MRRYWICDTRTGNKLARVIPSAGSFKRVLCGSGSGQHTFRLGFGKRSRDQWRDLTRPWARSLVIEEDGVVIYSGLIAKRTHKWKFWAFSISHIDMRELFRRRFPFGVRGYWLVDNVTPGKLVITGKSQRAVVGKLMEQSLLGPFGIWSLPILYPDPNEAGPISVTFENYLLRSTFDLFEDIQNLDGGPDIDFVPRWSAANTVEYVLEVGTAAAPYLKKGTKTFNMTVANHGLSDVTYDEDATDQLTGIFSVGAGSEALTAVGGNGLGDSATIPALDIVETHKAETSTDVLASLSTAGLRTLGHPTVQIGMSMLETPRRNLATMPVGTMLRTYFKNEPWIPDGWIETQVLTYSGDMTKKVNFETQPLIGA